MDFVLDNSVSMRWILASGKTKDQRYAETVLDSLVEFQAVVPDHWSLEVANVLVESERRGVVTVAEVEAFIARLEALTLSNDSTTSRESLGRTLVLARNYKLSSYDAAYLEIALRQGLPLATLDNQLIKAAKASGVPIFLS